MNVMININIFLILRVLYYEAETLFGLGVSGVRVRVRVRDTDT
jgi:hypothetical protein